MSQVTLTSPEDIATDRIIGHFEGNGQGPTLVFFGGIHGNEPSGVKALEHVFSILEENKTVTNGNVYGIRGNIPALLREQRFLISDLNRMWTQAGIDQIKQKGKEVRSHEENELAEIYTLLRNMLTNQPPPFYFIDFHTTSSETLPFITINDAVINRKFSSLFPVPVILGIEEYLEGPLLSHINEHGYVSMGFESGQHFTDEAEKNSIAFTWLTLLYTNVLKKEQLPEEAIFYRQLKASAQNDNTFYEVTHRHKIKPNDSFETLLGLQSFDDLKKGTVFARHNGVEIEAEKDSILFMPLYQKQGEEGFFLIRKIPQWALRLSAFLRKIKFDSFLTVLPGISRANGKTENLMVNLKVARFFSKPFFHLLGYRERVLDETHMILSNRERVAKNSMYRGTWWYRKMR